MKYGKKRDFQKNCGKNFWSKIFFVKNFFFIFFRFWGSENGLVFRLYRTFLKGGIFIKRYWILGVFLEIMESVNIMKMYRVSIWVIWRVLIPICGILDEDYGLVLGYYWRYFSAKIFGNFSEKVKFSNLFLNSNFEY